MRTTLPEPRAAPTVTDLLAAVPIEALARAYDAVIGPLAAYERTMGGNLVQTLRVYVACGGNRIAAAHRLGTHRNTVLNRLLRINHVLGIDVREPENLYGLHAALRAGDVLHAARPGAITSTRS
jgi:DNA-binding PucR family transcriptional regulator